MPTTLSRVQHALTRLALSLFILLPAVLVGVLLPKLLKRRPGADAPSPAAADAVLCVYPISGQYGLLVRLLFYALSVFGVLWRHHEWLVAGALASALTYAGAAAVHAVLLAGFRFDAALDLDLLPCNAILAASVAIVVPVLRFSVAGRRTRARPAIRAWAVLVAVGYVCTVVALWTDRPVEAASDAVAAATDPGGPPNASPAGSGHAPLALAHRCLAATSHIREPRELQTFPTARLEDPVNFKTFSVSMALGLALLASLLYLQSLPLAPWRRLGASRTVWGGLATALFGLNCGFFEYGLLSPPAVPYSEGPRSIGQWAPWVVAALVVAAALLIGPDDRTQPSFDPGGNDSRGLESISAGAAAGSPGQAPAGADQGASVHVAGDVESGKTQAPIRTHEVQIAGLTTTTPAVLKDVSDFRGSRFPGSWLQRKPSRIMTT